MRYWRQNSASLHFEQEGSNSLQPWSLPPEAVAMAKTLMNAPLVSCFPTPSRNLRLEEGGEDGPSPHPERPHHESSLSGRLQEAKAYLRERSWGGSQRGWLSTIFINDRATMTHLKWNQAGSLWSTLPSSRRGCAVFPVWILNILQGP